MGLVARLVSVVVFAAAGLLMVTSARESAGTDLRPGRYDDLADLARIASEVLGRPVAHVTISDDELRARLASRGAPAPAVAITLGLYAASRAGEFAAVDPTLKRLIGRRPTPMRDVLAGATRGRPQPAPPPTPRALHASDHLHYGR